MKENPSQDTRNQFSERLKTALSNRSIAISPTILRNSFNEHYDGKPISIQTASNWLSGVAIPSQDKLETLAEWLMVDVHWLRFGENSYLNNMVILSGVQLGVMQNFASLAPTHQKIVVDLIASLLPKKSQKK